MFLIRILHMKQEETAIKSHMEHQAHGCIRATIG